MNLRCFIALAFLPAVISAFAQENADSWSYKPVFNGEVLAYYRYSAATGDSRFQVPNARLSAGGYVFPFLDYFVQVDFCENGKIKLLDTYARVRPLKNLYIYAGQMRVPFSVESSRQPYMYHFADVGLTAQFGNLRSVGVKVGYTIPGTALYAEGGLFNATDKSDHTQWNTCLTYGIKANYTLKFGLKPEIAFMSSVPDLSYFGVRVNQYNASLSWKYKGLFVEGEYVYRTYAHEYHKASHAYSVFADYAFVVRSRMIDAFSIQARYDGITDASDGSVYMGGNSLLITNMPARQRITVGVKFLRTLGPLNASFKINYERYTYSDAMRETEPDDNQLIAGIALHF
ncbi:MAG: hypothetical protein J1F05_08010 [Muribaculaceae bacterium]|nr:hypothetical protein [Muribaculaceae bacterium]